MSHRPLIGITPAPSTQVADHGTFERFCIADTYVNAVWAAGGWPVALPWAAGANTDILDKLDGIVFSGGGDIDPCQFDQERHSQTAQIDAGRDTFELPLMRAAIARDLPTLAICRGIQIMTVALGGTLDQHVPDRATTTEHRQHVVGISQHDPSHLVVLENTPNPISELVDATSLQVNSFHHQAPVTVPEPLRIAGRAEDGTIEAVWHPGMTFGIGVQWHPEMLAAAHPQHAALFRGLVVAANAKLTATV